MGVEEDIINKPVPLSEDQKKAVLSTERFVRVIAGAGAGKTETIRGAEEPDFISYPDEPLIGKRIVGHSFIRTNMPYLTITCRRRIQAYVIRGRQDRMLEWRIRKYAGVVQQSNYNEKFLNINPLTF